LFEPGWHFPPSAQFKHRLDHSHQTQLRLAHDELVHLSSPFLYPDIRVSYRFLQIDVEMAVPGVKPLQIAIPRNYQKIDATDLAELVKKKDDSLAVVDVRDLDYPGGRISRVYFVK
jgi:hypothetical protein